MTRIRMRKSTLECGIVPQHQITLTLTPFVFPGQRAGSTTTSKPTTAQRQKRAKHATFVPLFIQNLDRSTSDWAPLTPKTHMEEAFAHPFSGSQQAEPFPEAEEPSREFKHRFTRHFHIQSPNASLTDIHPMPSYAHCRIHSIRSSPIEPFVAPLSTATHSMRSFIAPEQKHPLIGIRQGRLLDKLPPYVPRSMRFI